MGPYQHNTGEVQLLLHRIINKLDRVDCPILLSVYRRPLSNLGISISPLKITHQVNDLSRGMNSFQANLRDRLKNTVSRIFLVNPLGSYKRTIEISLLDLEH